MSEAAERARWRRALERGTLGLWDLEPQRESVRYTAAFKARLGFMNVGVADSTAFWRSRVHPDDFNGMLRALQLHLRGYTPTYEKVFRLRAGNDRYVGVSSRGRVVERAEGGAALRMMGTMVELDNRRQREGAEALDPVAALRPFGEADWPLIEQIGDLLALATRDAGG